MPHITIEAWPGRTPEAKAALAQAICDTVAKTLPIDPSHISISLHEVAKEDWVNTVVDRELAAPQDLLILSDEMRELSEKRK